MADDNHEADEAEVEGSHFSRDYRRLRNGLAATGISQSLQTIHAFTNHLQANTKLPTWVKAPEDIASKPRYERGLFEWEMDILCREIIISASQWGDRKISEWGNLVESVNRIKSIHDGLIRSFPEYFEGKIFAELFRIQHQQFPWQRKINMRHVVRYLRVFGDPVIDKMIQEKVGLRVDVIIRVGIALWSLFLKSFSINLPLSANSEIVGSSDVDKVVDWLGVSFSEIHVLACESRNVDQDFIYGHNPLVENPILLDKDGDKKLTISCPIPNHLIRRCTQGLYYDVCNDSRFGVEYGRSFQTYVGDVLRSIDSNLITVLPETSYNVGKARKDTVDWIAYDKTAYLFIECKTKRFTRAIKTAIANEQARQREIEIFSDMVCQLYKALSDALQGKYPSWKDDGKPVYPIIVFLEELYASGDFIRKPVIEIAGEKLASAGISPTIIERYPFTLVPVSDFEIALQIIERTGVEKLMSKKCEGEHRKWEMDSVMQQYFEDEMRAISGTIFPEETKRIFKKDNSA